MDNSPRVTLGAQVHYPSGQKYMWNWGEVQNLRAELERLQTQIRELQDRVDQLESARLSSNA